MMTREETIIQIDSLKKFCEDMAGSDESGSHVFDLDIQALDLVLATLRPVSREMVEQVWRGEWIEKDDDLYCSECGHIIPDCAGNATPIFKNENRFCYFCGTPMTNEAVDIQLKRIEALKGFADYCWLDKSREKQE